ncbi:MAG: antitoxin VapB family protein [Acidobacteriota bacterium]
MRTTIELKDEHRARLLELAARRGEKGFSGVISEAVELYLKTSKQEKEKRRLALALRGSLSDEEADGLRKETSKIRESWR